MLRIVAGAVRSIFIFCSVSPAADKRPYDKKNSLPWQHHHRKHRNTTLFFTLYYY